VLAILILGTALGSPVSGAILYESGTLGQTGLAQGAVAATNINPSVFTGVRFQLAQRVVTSQIGGHFVSQTGGTFFGTIVALDDAHDFPDSGDLTTPDVLGAASLDFPNPSAEVFGDLALSLDTGWYAPVYGSGLFGTTGRGVALRNGLDIGDPSYIAFQPGSGVQWIDISEEFHDHRFVITGVIVPESTSVSSLLIKGLVTRVCRRTAIARSR
jgi:hypothetical protein